MCNSLGTLKWQKLFTGHLPWVMPLGKGWCIPLATWWSPWQSGDISSHSRSLVWVLRFVWRYSGTVPCRYTDLVKSLVDPKVPSRRLSVEFCQLLFHLAPWKDYLGFLDSSIGWHTHRLALQHAVSHY
jgi:hypothetical protein